MPTNREPLMTADDVAAVLQIPAKTVENMARAGDIPSLKVGRARRFRASSIERWQREREAAASVPDAS